MKKAFKIIALLLCLLFVASACTQAPSDSTLPDSPVGDSNITTPNAPPQTAIEITTISTPTPAPTAQPTEAPELVIFESGASYLLDAESIETALASGEVNLLDKLENLKTANISGSHDYTEIYNYSLEHPQIEFIFTESLGPVSISQDVTDLDLTSVPMSQFNRLAQLLPLLKNLSYVNLTNTKDGRVAKGTDAKTALQKPNAEPEGSSTFAKAIGWQQWVALHNIRPDVVFDFVFSYKNKTFSSAESEIELSKIKMSEKDFADIAAIASGLANGTRIVMEGCGLSNEKMAELRDSIPNALVVWRVNFKSNSARTDARCIRLVMDGGKYYSSEDLKPLMYCTELEYLDVGHNKLRNINFVAYMPKLKVAILAIGYLKDISPIANCTELEYLELFTNLISDLSPLSGLTKLRHLNLTYNNITDPTPLYSLKDLERLWIGRTTFSSAVKNELQAAMPNCIIDYGHSPTGGVWREHPRYDQLCIEFDYASVRNGQLY